MQDFPANSQKAKARSETPPPPERPKIERVTTAEAVRRKRGLGRKFKDTFIAGNARDTVDYMIVDVVVPAIKDTMIDAFQGGIERLFNGNTHRSRRHSAPSAYSTAPRVNYQSMSKPPSAEFPAQRMLSRRARNQQDFGEIIIESRREAEDVLEQMYEILSRFGEVKLSDLYTMTGIASSHVDHKWGWTSLQGAKLARTRDNRFLLDLPEPEDLA